jgi:hypothetical protein
MTIAFDDLAGILSRVEALAAKSPDWARTYLADLLVQFRPQFSSALARGDQPGFNAAVMALSLMVKRCLLTMSF